MANLRKQWNDTCKAAGIKPISKYTAANIMAIMYLFGDEHESMTHNEKLMTDVKYIQEEYGINGGEMPTEEFFFLIQDSIQKVRLKNGKANNVAKKLMLENYNITL